MKKTEHLTFTLTPQEKQLIIDKANKERRKPSEFIYLLVMDTLKGVNNGTIWLSNLINT